MPIQDCGGPGFDKDWELTGQNAVLPRLGPWIKPILRRYWLFSRGMTLGVRCAAFDEKGRVFLIRHTYTPGWHFPGGGVEIGETIFDALDKELREEANLVLDEPAELFGFYCNRNHLPRDHVAFFVARRWRQPEAPVPTAEIAEHGWFDADRLPEGTTVSSRARLDEINGAAEKAVDW